MIDVQEGVSNCAELREAIQSAALKKRKSGKLLDESEAEIDEEA
jgi:hypothetical protein